MSGTHTTREKYAGMIVKLYRKRTFIRNLFSRDYEGEPVSGSVKIPVRNGEVLIQAYNITDGVSLSTSTTGYLDVLINNDNSFNELIDGYEAAAVPDNLAAQRVESAGYSSALMYEASAITALMDGTHESSYGALTADDVYSKIKDSVLELKKLGMDVPEEVKVVVSVDTEGLLLESPTFANSAGKLGEELLRQGVIGKIAGAHVHTSALLPSLVEFITFGIPWAQSIDAWKSLPGINDLKDGKHIGSSALQGRMVYRDILTVTTAARIKLILLALVSSSPAHDEIDVAIDTNIELTFAKDIELGSSGTIEIREESDDSLVESYAVGDSEVSVEDEVLTIDRSGESDLDNETKYYVSMTFGTVVSIEEGSPAVIAANELEFTTVASA